MRRVVDVLMGEAQTPVGRLLYGAEGARETSSFEYAETPAEGEQFADAFEHEERGAAARLALR